MKNYIVVGLLVIILVLSSLLYKKGKTTVPRKFPVQKEEVANKSKVEVPLLLYIFFSKNNCRDCLEVIKVLNNLPPHFLVKGIVPRDELKDEQELRSITGAEFPIVSHTKYKKYIPWYTPSIIGASPISGHIVFSLPGVPGSKEYVIQFLESLYEKAYPIFLREKSIK